MKTKHGRSLVKQDYNDSRHFTAHEAEVLECYAKLRAVLITTYYVQMKEVHFVFLINQDKPSTKKNNVSGESLETFQCQ